MKSQAAITQYIQVDSSILKFLLYQKHNFFNYGKPVNLIY